MGHKIVEAIIEDKQIKYLDRQLPSGRIKAHIIYDTEDETLSETEIAIIVKETSGIYKDIDVISESRKIRASWERNIDN